MRKLSLLALIFCTAAYASESGFIRNGKTYTVYKDGEKVGKTAQELGFAVPTEGVNRKTAAFGNDSAVLDTLWYQTDAQGTTCYYFNYSNLSPLSCVHK